jgi:hypothetical protein
MPARDGTGPMGMGPMSGGGRGWCNPYYFRTSPTLGVSPYFRPLSWGSPYGSGIYTLNPMAVGFRAFPYRPFRCGRGLRRWRW